MASFEGARGSQAVSKLGLAFVAWTRATRWEKMAFHKLPPLADFVAARLTREFAARCAFESYADDLVEKFLQQRGLSVESLVQAHQTHFKAMEARNGRDASEAELADLRAMLCAEGVAPVSESIASYSKEHAGQKNAGLWSFVASFRAEKRKTKAPGTASAAPKGSPGIGSSCTLEEDAAVLQASAAAEESARQSMVGMGFSSVDITTALERSGFAFGPALLLLLNGLGQQRTKTGGQQSERFRRHVRKKTFAPKEEEALSGHPVFSQYTQRMFEYFGISASVWDLGQYAGDTSAACFWLSLAAGLARCNEDVLGQALPVDHPARTLVAQLRIEGVAHSVIAGVRGSTLGLCAAALRHHFCFGPTAVLMRADVKNKIYPAFASLAVRGPQRTEQIYERWVAKLAFKEYADELVVVAVALELSIRIVVIPYTPESALRPWAIPTYGSTGVAQDARRTIYLGNNDVHYVYLKPED